MSHLVDWFNKFQSPSTRVSWYKARKWVGIFSDLLCYLVSTIYCKLFHRYTTWDLEISGKQCEMAVLFPWFSRETEPTANSVLTHIHTHRHTYAYTAHAFVETGEFEICRSCQQTKVS